MSYSPPSPDCPLCPRLRAFILDNRLVHKTYFDAPVPSFGAMDAPLLVVGLAPGMQGANRTGRPFTGDYAGLVLYASLRKFGFADGNYDPEMVAKASGPKGRGADAKGKTPYFHNADGFQLINTRISNGVRCVPPQNKPEPSEIKQCNNFLSAEIKAMPQLKVILSLGLIAHKAVMMAFGLKQSAHVFGHGAKHDLGRVQLINSYHCSRYNINTGTLTQAMFDEVMKMAKALLNG